MGVQICILVNGEACMKMQLKASGQAEFANNSFYPDPVSPTLRIPVTVLKVVGPRCVLCAGVFARNGPGVCVVHGISCSFLHAFYT